MRRSDWLKLMSEEPRCEVCFSSELRIGNENLIVRWRERTSLSEKLVLGVPVGICKSCGEIHMSNLVAIVLENQRYQKESEVEFYVEGIESLLSDKTKEEREIEMNCYFSVMLLMPRIEIHVLDQTYQNQITL